MDKMFSVDELHVILAIINGIISNRQFEAPGVLLRKSTVYGLSDYDLDTLYKAAEFLQKTIETKTKKDGNGRNQN